MFLVQQVNRHKPRLFRSEDYIGESVFHQIVDVHYPSLDDLGQALCGEEYLIESFSEEEVTCHKCLRRLQEGEYA